MRSTANRVLLLSGLAAAWLASPLLAQSALPSTPPAAAVRGTPASTPAHSPSHRAEVSFANGQLTVQAHNTSLNQLIRDIARQTGMRVSGSVAEDRVFGSYGPADPSRVLALLLDGTGSNLLIVQNEADRPTELILTPRTGAATPPNPNAAAENDADPDDEAVAATPIRRGGPSRFQLPQNAPQYRAPAAPAPAPTSATQPGTAEPDSTDQTVAFPQVGPNATPATASTTDNVDTTDKAVRTPQQIFEELQKLQQQTPPK